MSKQVSMWLEDLKDLRERLARVDTDHAPEIAGKVQAEMLTELAVLESILRGKVRDLDEVIRTWDYRACYDQRMDREEILRAFGELDEEPEPRDTPKLNALMNKPGFTFGPNGVIEAVAEAQKDFGPSLEDMLFFGADKALAEWVDGLNPAQLGGLLVMGPRLMALVRQKYASLESMQGPGDQIQHRKFIDRGPLLNNRKPGTEPLNDTEPGSFDG